MLYDGDVLLQFEGQGCTQAIAAIHIEGLGLLRASAVLDHGISQCTFYTDSLALWKSITNPKTPVYIQWQIYNEVKYRLQWSLLN